MDEGAVAIEVVDYALCAGNDTCVGWVERISALCLFQQLWPIGLRWSAAPEDYRRKPECVRSVCRVL